jgi:hypothetical protein
MSNFSYLAPSAVGPVWPAMLLCSIYMLAVTGFIVIAKIRRRSRSPALAEHQFFHRLYDATQMAGALAIVFGMLGAFAGLLEALTAIGASWREGRNADLLRQALPSLRYVLASPFAGLILGGLWCELILFLLKPYTRPTLMPLCDETSSDEPITFEDSLPPEPGAAPRRATPGTAAPGRPGAGPPNANDLDVAEDWRESDREGIY